MRTKPIKLTKPGKSRLHILIIWLVMFILALQLVAALGIRPAKTSIISEETRNFAGEFWVVNNEERAFSMRVSVEGEIAQYVTLATKELVFRDDDEAKPVLFEVHLPEEVPAGKSVANIVIEEVLGKQEGSVISSRIILKHKVIVQGEYPDKFIIAKLNFHEEEDAFEMISEVENLGKQDVEQVQTKFYVNDREEEMKTLETETTALKTSENKLLRARLEKNVLSGQGEFEVLAVTTFDDQKIELEKILVLGRPEVEVTYFNEYFTANKINQYTMDLMNRWNKEVKNVFVDVEVKKDGRKVDEFRTRSVDIEGEMVKRIQDYLDARDKGMGKYTFEMVINFWNLVRMDSRRQTFESEFIEEKEFEKIMLRDSSITGAAAAEADGENISPFWVLALIIAVAVLVLGSVLIVRRKYFSGDADDVKDDVL